MAKIQVTLVSGAVVDVETTDKIADDMVAAFARYVSGKRTPEKRTILTPSQSIYVDFSKAAIVRRAS
ncbi:MAG: hypothetical protein GC187_06480 [Alphaproteobacteria bacterium]|nr:hypothetical protein [Alphaproteobacteria bacterium]